MPGKSSDEIEQFSEDDDVVNEPADEGQPSVPFRFQVSFRILHNDVYECITVELCAGSAQLSASLKQLGFQSLAYDHSKNRHNKRHAVLHLDLS